MSYKSILLVTALMLLTASCVEHREETYTYTVEGDVKNIVNKPLEGIRVIMNRTYSGKMEADTAYTDSQGKYLVSLTVTSRQRVFLVDYSDPKLKYRDTLRRFTFDDQGKLYDSMMLRTRNQVDPF
ncbi:MAG: radical SAM-associated putative lipoprotein [Bacteroidales bacterium]|nr:radical SAM-associated putative lipoprotein [Bacteroidales bacterium]MDD3521500.1 radical SAM-associated putative lipoprotein [Bacteroidales bacterium]MDD4030534.1 radical SAM-associated putative lipoprotein [Bacteroidales bacterium]MDD4434871.1 radical SAM-associated putative lipoprotein [Bacteroidales bacterium]MDD5732554.1 radical SAM-associated putative lipoprotein [Bacteroidales bacterium]